MAPTLALDVGGTAVKSGLIDESGNFIAFSECPSDAKKGGPFLMRRMCEVISQYSGYDKIGISVTGQVDTESGTIVYANDNVPGFTGTNVKEIVSSRFGTPVCVENDVNSAAVGEAVFGAGKDFENFLCLTYGTGIGGAIVSGRRVYHGSDGIAGEFGHIVTHPGGKSCACGFRGCYEQYASTTALVKSAAKEEPACADGRAVFEALASGNAKIKTVVDCWIDEIVLGLISLTHIFNPGCMVLGGGIMNEPYVIGEVDKKLHSHIMQSFRKVAVRQAKLGNRAGLLGAMYIARTL